MELRWLKGDFKFGKFKLQYRNFDPNCSPSYTDWFDVPIDEGKSILKKESRKQMLAKKLKSNYLPTKIGPFGVEIDYEEIANIAIRFLEENP